MSSKDRRADLTPARNRQAPGTGDSISSSSDIFSDWGASVRNFIWPSRLSDNHQPHDSATTSVPYSRCAERARSPSRAKLDDMPTLTTCSSLNVTLSSASTMSTLPPTTQNLLPSTTASLPSNHATEPVSTSAAGPKAALQRQHSLRGLPDIPDILPACVLPSTTTTLPSTAALPCTIVLTPCSLDRDGTNSVADRDRKSTPALTPCSLDRDGTNSVADRDRKSTPALTPCSLDRDGEKRAGRAGHASTACVDKNKKARVGAECGGSDIDAQEEELWLQLSVPRENEECDPDFAAPRSRQRRDAVLGCQELPSLKSNDSSNRTLDSWKENEDVDNDELSGTTGASIYAKLTNYNEPGKLSDRCEARRLMHYNKERPAGIVDSTRFGPRRKMELGGGNPCTAHASPRQGFSASGSPNHANPRLLLRNTNLLAVPTPASASTAYSSITPGAPLSTPDSHADVSCVKTALQSENRCGRRCGRLKVLTNVPAPEGTSMCQNHLAKTCRDGVAEETSGGDSSPADGASPCEIAGRERRRAQTEHDVHLRVDLADKVREIERLKEELAGAHDVHALKAEITDQVREITALKAELLTAKTEARKWKDELAREQREKEDWLMKTENEYNALLEDLALARAEHQRDNDTKDRHIEWLYNKQNLLQAQLDLCAVTEKHTATIHAQDVVKKAVNVALTSGAFLDEAEKKLPVFVQQRARKKAASMAAIDPPVPANRKTSNFFELLSRHADKGNLIEGAYLIKNGKIAGRYPLEKYDVLDQWTIRYVKGALNAEGTATSSPEPLSYALLDELQQAQGPRTQFFVFSLLSAAKDAQKRPATDEDRPIDVLFGHSLIFPFVKNITDGDIARPAQNAVLGTMGIVLISRFPLLVLFRDLLTELFQCNYLQLDARLRRLIKGKKPDTMTWSDAARQLLRITYSQRWNESSCLTIAIPSYAGREHGGKLTHFLDDRLSATEMLGEIFAPWNQYKSAFIDVLAAFMLERKVAIISSNVRSGSVMSVALRALIAPFVWHHVFQASMPSSLVDKVPMMDAPFPFLVHMHSSTVPKSYPLDVVVCTIGVDTLKVVNAEKDVFPPKLLSVLRCTESVAQLTQVMGDVTRELHATLTSWGQCETTQPMANSKAFLKKHKLPLFRSTNDEFLINFFKTQQCCQVVDSATKKAG